MVCGVAVVVVVDSWVRVESWVGWVWSALCGQITWESVFVCVAGGGSEMQLVLAERCEGDVREQSKVTDFSSDSLERGRGLWWCQTSPQPPLRLWRVTRNGGSHRDTTAIKLGVGKGRCKELENNLL